MADLPQFWNAAYAFQAGHTGPAGTTWRMVVPEPDPVKHIPVTQFYAWLAQMNEITTRLHKVAFSSEYHSVPEFDDLTEEELREVLSEAIDAIAQHALKLSRRVINLPDNWGDHLTV